MNIARDLHPLFDYTDTLCRLKDDSFNGWTHILIYAFMHDARQFGLDICNCRCKLKFTNTSISQVRHNQKCIY